MNGWHGRRLCALSLAGWGLLAAGCQAGTSVTRPAGSADFPALIQMAGTPTAINRGQKPDAIPNPLNFRPDDPGSPETRTARIRAVVNDRAILDEEVQASAYQALLG